MKRRKLLNSLGMLSLLNMDSHLASVLHAQENFLAGTPIANIRLPHLTEDKNAPNVFYSPIVSSEAMLKLLEASQYKPSGKVGIKMTFSNIRDSAVKIDPMLIKPLSENVKGTMIDSNYFDGARSNTQAHLATAKANGFDKGETNSVPLPQNLRSSTTMSSSEKYGTAPINLICVTAVWSRLRRLLVKV